VGTEAWGWTWWVYTVSPSGQHLSGLSAAFSPGRFLKNEGGRDEKKRKKGGGCHIPVTSKIHPQWEYNGQDLSRTGKDFVRSKKHREECSRV